MMKNLSGHISAPNKIWEGLKGKEKWEKAVG